LKIKFEIWVLVVVAADVTSKQVSSTQDKSILKIAKN